MFVNAQDMAKKYPATFHAPDASTLARIIPGSFVKVCACDERFWALVRVIDGDTITAEVNNDLVRTNEHGLKCGDVITFQFCHVYNIYEEPTCH